MAACRVSDAGERGDCAPNDNGPAASRKVGRVGTLAMPTTDKPPNQINAAATIKSDARQARVFVGVKVAPEIAHETPACAEFGTLFRSARPDQ